VICCDPRCLGRPSSDVTNKRRFTHRSIAHCTGSCRLWHFELLTNQVSMPAVLVTGTTLLSISDRFFTSGGHKPSHGHMARLSWPEWLGLRVIISALTQLNLRQLSCCCCCSPLHTAPIRRNRSGVHELHQLSGSVPEVPRGHVRWLRQALEQMLHITRCDQ